MIIYQRNIEKRILIKLEEENGSWNISKYYNKNAFFIVEKNNNHSSMINIGFCMLNGEHFKITEEGKNRKFKYENNRLYIEEIVNDSDVLVVMPTYNRSNNIKNTIQLIDNQTYKKSTLLIIDDGSTPEHKVEFNLLKDKYRFNNKIIFLENNVNKHIAYTLNKGIEYFLNNEQYKYFTWISDDNHYEQTYINDLKINNNYFKYSSFTFINLITNKIHIVNQKYDNMTDLLNNFKGCASFMWTKNAIKEIGFYQENINGCEDYEYLLRTFNKNKECSFIDKSLMKYNRHSSSLYVIDNKNIRALKNNIDAIFRHFNNNSSSFVYYSKTKYKLLFQRPHQIMRFYNKNDNKCFIGEIDGIEYEDKYKLLIVPYKLKDIVYNAIREDIITYYTDTRLYEEVNNLKGKKIYDLIDAPINDFAVWKPNLENSVKSADYVIYSHPDLIKFLNEIDDTKKYNYISNACDYEFFSKAKNRIGRRPVDFPNTNKQILGYYGSFAKWKTDYNFIKKCADNSKYHIVMIGGIKENSNYNYRFNHRNITWLDHKPYEELAYYLSWFDICLLPFKKCELTKYVNPCKLWEYMASEKKIIKHNVNIENNNIIKYEDICIELYNIINNKNLNTKIVPNNSSILIVLDKYLKGGLEKHTDILQYELNSDVMVFNNSVKNHKKVYNNYINYDIVIWQNIFNRILNKKSNQKYIYIVHSQCDWWNKKQKEIVRNNDSLIDIYIYVSNSVKENFEKNILVPKNSYVIENQISEIKNNKKEIPRLYISSGSYNKLKGHYELICEFSKLDKSNRLEIYGDIHDKKYYDMLQKYISYHNLNNIKLFEYTDNYLERLKEAEYFCMFSKSEGCSYSMLEAINLNKRIICTKECLTDNMSNYQNLSYEFKKYTKNNSNNSNNFYFIQCYEFIINNIKNEIIINKNIFDKFYDYISNENKYDVTIVTPSYNCSKTYMSELKTSIEKQTFQNWFWLIINDRSTNENSIEYLNELNKYDNIVIFSNYENKKLPGTRNTGWNICKSKYIFFIDDDDLIEETQLEKLFWCISTEPNITFVNSYLLNFGCNNFKWEKGCDLIHSNMYENFLTSSFMVRSNLKYRFNDFLINGCEDWDFWCLLIDNNIIGYTIPELNFKYRIKARTEKIDWNFNLNEWKKYFKNKYPSIFSNRENIGFSYRNYYKLEKGDFPGYGFGKIVNYKLYHFDFDKNILSDQVILNIKNKINYNKISYQNFDLQHYKKIINDKVTYESYIKKNQYIPWHTVPYKQLIKQNFEYIGEINKNYKCDFMFILPGLCMGGADRFNINLINSLQKKGKKILVVYTECDIFNKKINEWIDKITVKDSHILYHFLSIHEYKKYIFYLINTRRPDHIFISNSMYGTHITKDIKEFIDNKSIKSTLSHYVHMEQESWYDGGYANFAIVNLNYLDNIYVTTNYLKKWMLNRLSLDICDKIKVFLIGTNTNTFKYNKIFNSNENILNVISICRFVDQKKPMQMLKLIHKLQNIGLRYHFNMYGHGPYEKKMKEYINVNKLKIVTLHIGNRSDVEKLLYQSHILLQTSLMEGLPSNFFEAISCGVPVISNNVGGNSTLIENGKNGYLINPDHNNDDYEINQYIEIFKKLDYNRNLLLDMHNYCIYMRNDLEIEKIVDKILL